MFGIFGIFRNSSISNRICPSVSSLKLFIALQHLSNQVRLQHLSNYFESMKNEIILISMAVFYFIIYFQNIFTCLLICNTTLFVTSLATSQAWSRGRYVFEFILNLWRAKQFHVSIIFVKNIFTCQMICYCFGFQQMTI